MSIDYIDFTVLFLMIVASHLWARREVLSLEHDLRNAEQYIKYVESKLPPAAMSEAQRHYNRGLVNAFGRLT